MLRASSAHHQESLTVHTASSFCVCVCLRHCLLRNLLYMFRASSAHHQEFLTIHIASSFCVCVCLRHCLVRNFHRKFLTRQCRRQTQTRKLEAICTVRDSWWWALDARNMRLCLVTVLQDSAADRHKHRNWRLYVRWGTLDDERLTLETCRVIHM
jgi:hypothetical protein